jgi:LCP family protein required for cell wall assembly
MTDPPNDPRSINVASPTSTTQSVVAPVLPKPIARRRGWARLGKVVLGLFGVLVVVALAIAAMAWGSWRDVERVELEGILAGNSRGTNYLVVGTDSRKGVASDAANAGVIFGEGITGERTDTIAVIRIEDGEVSLLAIPRDLYLPIDGGSPGRINAAFVRGGPAGLIRTVQSELGIGIDHYLEVDFAGFLGLVDALGGITIELPYASRNYIELVDGVERRDPTSDLGRVQRQQQFLGALFAELGRTINPFTLLDALDAVAHNVRVDAGLSLSEAAQLGLGLRGASPSTATVPTTPSVTGSGAQVLLLEAGASDVLDAFRP